jgi:fluoride exporter
VSRADPPPSRRVQIAVGGALGASGRVLVVTGLAAGAGDWPWGVLVVNLAGALLLGVVAGRMVRSPLVERWAPLLGTGVAGTLTTFSALAVDLAALVTTRPALALAYAAASLLGGAALAWTGLRIGRGRP